MESRKHQHKALDEVGNIIDIEDAQHGRKYYCINCGEEVIPVKGKKREFHFRHKHDNPSCSYESYLHKLAKLKIYEWLCDTDEIELLFRNKCPKASNCFFWIRNCELHYRYKLKERVNIKGIEQPHDGFVPDILLMSKGPNYEPIFIEIYVTHECSQKKIASNIKIIEFKIEEEKDIKTITQRKFINESESVVFHNFKPKNISSANPPNVLCGVLTIEKSGQIRKSKATCIDIYKNPEGLCQILFLVSKYEYKNILLWGYTKALQHGLKVKNCSICKFCRWNDSHNADICILYKTAGFPPKCVDNDATTCPRFQQEQLNELNQRIPDTEYYILCDYTDGKFKVFYGSEYWETTHDTL
ncbi:MAG: hypothetical protein HUK02_05985 [Bacteroidaceae bacterium]|nr:hypothetical protein [Bacteroidaceae bacterium]